MDALGHCVTDHVLLFSLAAEMLRAKYLVPT